jgi:hypothetical protein
MTIIQKKLTYVFATTFLCTLLSACIYSTKNLDDELSAVAVANVEADLAGRVQRLHLETPGFRLKTDGTTGAGTYSASDGTSLNGVFVFLFPMHNADLSIMLPLYYDYRSSITEGDTKFEAFIQHRPTDIEIRDSVRIAYTTYARAFWLAQLEFQKKETYKYRNIYIDMILQKPNKNDPGPVWGISFRENNGGKVLGMQKSIQNKDGVYEDIDRQLADFMVNTDTGKVTNFLDYHY